MKTLLIIWKSGLSCSDVPSPFIVYITQNVSLLNMVSFLHRLLSFFHPRRASNRLSRILYARNWTCSGEAPFTPFQSNFFSPSILSKRWSRTIWSFILEESSNTPFPSLGRRIIWLNLFFAHSSWKIRHVCIFWRIPLRETVLLRSSNPSTPPKSEYSKAICIIFVSFSFVILIFTHVIISRS